MQLEWLLFGSSGCSVAPGYGRMEVLNISAVLSDSLGVVINFIYLLVCFVVVFFSCLFIPCHLDGIML